MLHVPDDSVQRTVDWYRSIGFEVLNTFADDDEPINFALMAYGNSQVMVAGGGRTSTDKRRDVDLYIHVTDVQGIYESLRGLVEIVVDMEDAFHGNRQFIVRDPNGFWVTFGQELENSSS